MTSYRKKPGAPSRKTSQGGYGHRSSTGGRVKAQRQDSRTGVLKSGRRARGAARAAQKLRPR